MALEKDVEKPYVKNKERPYYLHAIICHDGLAENGHYYTYIFDRNKKVWYKMDDHKASIVDESIVDEKSISRYVVATMTSRL